ncbi:MAG: hypothetical protein HQL58_09800 [Magnetococcales bacterium]|nr:hypothetical protein [Magnetococcales bacterium]
MEENNWIDAILKVFREEQSSDGLHYTDIAERILLRGYYKTGGATPASTVNAQITASIKHKGLKSPFMRAGKGTYQLNPLYQSQSQTDSQSASEKNVSQDSPSSSIINAFGMYWQRDRVVWCRDVKLFGKQIGAKSVDFGRQKGIYVLYDNHTVGYIGRVTDRPLGQRLWEHTVDRLAGRWNRFSWFGLLGVKEDGSLCEKPLKVDQTSLIATLEALLIENLEPPQNRRRGDGILEVEYIQADDPAMKEIEIQNTLSLVEQKIRLANNTVVNKQQ